MMLSLEKFLTVLTRYCVEHHIHMAYARQYDVTMFQHDQNDVDIILLKENIPEIEGMIRMCPGLKIVSRIDHLTNTQFYIHGIQQKSLQFLCLDVHHSFSLKGLSYLNTNAVLLRSVPATNQIGLQPHAVDLGLIYVFTHILKHQNVSDIVKIVIYKAYKTGGSTFTDILKLYFGEKSNRYLDHLLKEHNVRRSAKMLTRIYCKRRSQQDGFISALAMLIYYSKTLWLRMFERRDIRLVVLGTDGAGKTSFIKLLKPYLTNLRPHIVHAHALPVRPGHLEVDSNATNSTPHALPDRSWLVSNLKITYFFLQYWLDAVWPWPVSRLILYDRYFLDVIADPRRFRFGGSFRLAAALFKHLPHIDVYIWIATPPEKAYQRKPELPLPLVQEHYNFYQAFCQGRSDCIIVHDLELSDQTARTYLEKIITHCTRQISS